MPFKSQAQRRFMYAKHPKMAARWQEHTTKGKSLPDHVTDKKAASDRVADAVAELRVAWSSHARRP